MATPKKPAIEYELYFLTVKEFSVSYHSGLNYKAVEAANKYEDDIPVFAHYPKLVFDCVCFYPEVYDGISFDISVYGDNEKNSLTLSDCAVRDDNGHPKRFKRRGQLYPVHELPTGNGYLEKVRGSNEWRATSFIHAEAVSTMISLLSLKEQFYISLDVSKTGRNRAVRALDIQTEKPE